ncbi:hypothetical protein [Desertivirga arenae]|uniref:hypothetical protein n=1 Tax=Desertivirga arenae TaxID=2810309 RepID=UPI001A972DE6|nr:hypothetical protein [Pedobacter sp. SYSU D00823]
MSYRQSQQKSPEKRFLFVFRFIRIAFFLVLGLLVIFTKFFTLNIDRPYQIAFGALLIVYALFRFFWEMKNSATSNDDED